MRKLLFFDVDGTLYNSDKKLPQSAKEAIFAARANGYEIAIATGRAPFMIQAILEELDIDTYVTFNGQYVVYKGEVIFTDGIPNEQLKEIIAFGEMHNHPVVFLDEERMIAAVGEDSRIGESLATLRYPYPQIDASYYEQKSVYQTLLYITEDEQPLYEETFPQVSFVRWHPYSCDMLPRGGSKARGIEKLLAHCGGTMQDVYAFGDGLNDIEMLQAVGCGVAMGNSHTEVKTVADVVIGHVDEDGLAKGMRRLGLIK
ncbi:MAG: Cof-type HAD-IIB family hydrolase [Solibacillus sp.]